MSITFRAVDKKKKEKVFNQILDFHSFKFIFPHSNRTLFITIYSKKGQIRQDDSLK